MAGTKRPSDIGDGQTSKKAKFAKGSSKAPSLGTQDDFVPFDKSKEHKYPKQNYGKNKEGHGPPNKKSSAPSEPYLGGAGGTTSRESHVKQKALAQERKAAKPNADLILRSKKIWERLRRKSHVPKEERETLVKELFEIISGRVKDFVFKHDSVRVIQCALKYATPEQRKQIAGELRGSYRELAESKYAKFLIAKMVVNDDEVKNAVVEEFYGHVKRLIRHPEASWIVDDIYRSIATKSQKAVLLREWYGPEFVVFTDNRKSKSDGEVTGDLSDILAQNPEKRGPIMQHLKEMTNQLVQKKTTGFTILHDALLQYFLNCKPASPEITEFLEMLRDDEEGDCYKNLAFTKSGSRLVCLALAHESSKGRRTILRFFKTHIRLLAEDLYGHTVLMTAYDVIDDTVMTGKAIFAELLSRDLGEAADEALVALTEHLTGRVSLLYLMSADPPKWLFVNDEVIRLREDVHKIRAETSKKDAETRRKELVKQISQPLLDLIASHAKFLASSNLGCQFITETLFGAIGDKQAALEAVAQLSNTSKDAESKIVEEGAEAGKPLLSSPAVGRMLKALVQGGRFDKSTKTIVKCDPPVEFHNILYDAIVSQGEDELVNWANGANSFVVVALLETEGFARRQEVVDRLRKDKSKLDSEKVGSKIILEKIS
ncbi:hypothetical protein B0A52_04334 [Exophiala mesophila]|uniref:PUM-HD domain-containing protein n=1 Tax=Exophiala mesophila TaxID=212818 RepID=A0A438N845_EXOME|nr:hypothetical protein B0A52_04334 [Exophiala mesophila]